MVGANEVGISEYFYNENPPPLLELALPPLLDIFESDFQAGSILDNPLQPGGPATNNPLPEITENPATSGKSTNTISKSSSNEAEAEPEPDSRWFAPRNNGTTSSDRARSVLNPSGF